MDRQLSMMERKRRHINLFIRILSRLRRQPRGQSFIELMLVVLILGLMLAGMVEFGFMLNNYLHVLDGSREAARYSSTASPFVMTVDGLKIRYYYYPPFYYQAAGKAAQTMDPVTLDPLLAPTNNAAHTDDIVISVFSMVGNTPTRFPGNPNATSPEVYPSTNVDSGGWSLCAHYKANTEDINALDARGQPYPFNSFASYFPTLPGHPTVPAQLSDPGWSSGCKVRTSQIALADVTTRLNGMVPPNSGFVLVEIFYNYPQLLKLPVLTQMVPDPIELYVYSIMPLSAAEPTQVSP